MHTTPRREGTSGTRAMYVAFELSNKNWKLGISDGSKTRIIDVTAADLAGVQEAIKKARERFRLPDQTPAYSCYEAGRDGFWLHRWLTQQGINNRVVDSSSIEVNRRARRAKTDRLDVQKLLTMLMRAVGGERGVWKEVKVPTVAQEDDRRPQRELLALQEDEGRTVSQMRSVLKLFGIDDRRLKRRLKALDELRQHDGQPLPFNVRCSYFLFDIPSSMRPIPLHRREGLQIHLRQDSSAIGGIPIRAPLPSGARGRPDEARRVRRGPGVRSAAAGWVPGAGTGAPRTL